MILITGAAGFIGSCMVAKLNEAGEKNLILVDDFRRADKKLNYEGKFFHTCVDRGELFTWLEKNGANISSVIHLGARTDTTEKRTEIFEELNLVYSQKIWRFCTDQQVPLIYASSAATYGDGNLGFSDDPKLADKLLPLNPYGWSKHQFDQWISRQTTFPPYWVGLKFFNVYGPNEYHKGRMASVIFHAFHQIKTTGELRLFRSHRPDYGDGEQIRDFVYVKDVVDIIHYLTIYGKNSGIYNLGTGAGRYFKDLGKQVFKSMGLEEKIRYIDTPIDIRDSYQYYTEADMKRFKELIFPWEFTSLEEGTDQYIRQYLLLNRYY
ncbi:MAG: ADP-glyceromanno-heptose 6-epimerase [Bacteroidia bacterium]|nr:ADP-glyceromanno-heptose 6-epimerase [Bacteroidia bacterium]